MKAICQRKINIVSSDDNDAQNYIIVTLSKIELGNRNINLNDFIILKLILEFEYQDFFDDFEGKFKN